MSFSPALNPATSSGSVDFVESDFDALASHMERCAKSRGVLPGIKSAIQAGHALAAGRLVTVSCAVAGLVIALLAFA